MDDIGDADAAVGASGQVEPGPGGQVLVEFPHPVEVADIILGVGVRPPEDVHLLDEQWNRVAGFDVLLDGIADEVVTSMQPEKPFMISHHTLELPVDLPPGLYNLAVGLYYFDDQGSLVNVNAEYFEKFVPFE